MLLHIDYQLITQEKSVTLFTGKQNHLSSHMAILFFQIFDYNFAKEKTGSHFIK